MGLGALQNSSQFLMTYLDIQAIKNLFEWAISSGDRASGFGPEGRGFKSLMARLENQ